MRQSGFFFFQAGHSERSEESELMSTTPPTYVPTELRAGDTWKWTRSLKDYPASAWDLKYEIRGEGAGAKLSITADESGDDFSVTVTAADSKKFGPGMATIQEYVTGGTSEQYTIQVYTVSVLPFIGNLESPYYDAKTTARQALDNLNQAIIAWSKNPTQQITIAGRTKIWSGEELVKMKRVFEQEVRNEEKAEKIRRGIDAGGKILIRMDPTS